MTEEERQRKIAALNEELRGYELSGRKDRAEQVREQLGILGASKGRPAKPQTNRLRGKAAEKR